MHDRSDPAEFPDSALLQGDEHGVQGDEHNVCVCVCWCAGVTAVVCVY